MNGGCTDRALCFVNVTKQHIRIQYVQNLSAYTLPRWVVRFAYIKANDLLCKKKKKKIPDENDD